MSRATTISQPSSPPTVALSVNGSHNLEERGASLLSVRPSTEDCPQVNGNGSPSSHASRSSPARKKCKAHVNVASLNIRGRGSTQQQAQLKWNQIHFLLRDKKIGVLALQETHMNDKTRALIDTLYGRRITILDSADPVSQNTAGVAFILNKDLTRTQDTVLSVLIPGRAILLKLPWNGGETLHILNVYAPNSSTDNATFWETLSNEWTSRRLPKPDILLGDFNITCDSIDRFPHKPPKPTPSSALLKVVGELALVDGWRARNPGVVDFSFPAYPTTHHKSRIDRIYISDTLLKTTEGWDILNTNVQTDHKLVIAQVAAKTTPFIGKGRWTLPLSTLNDKQTLKLVQKRASLFETDLQAATENRTEMTNPQVVYQKFKLDLTTILRTRSKIIASKTKNRCSDLSNHLREVQNSSRANEPDMILEAALLQQEINDLEQARYLAIKDATKTAVQAQNETMSRYWVRLNKEKTPRDVLYSLIKPTLATNEDPLEHRSDRMAEIARNHHEKLQDVGLDGSDEEREDAISTSLDAISTKLKKSQQKSLNSPFSATDVRTALLSTSQGKATGLDGLPYEFWSVLDKIYLDGVQNSQLPAPFNPMSALASVFNDISDHGIAEDSTFTEGWMCPIYKNKGDRREIVNYRPITLLNTDYKMMTKIIAVRLALVANTLVHKDQAGFIPGRSIADQVRLVQSMLDLAEATEENGVVIALDQEKAYDKVSHDYLWRVLAKFNVPQTTISTIQALYTNASTRVAINGEMSTPFRVTRGVRQGDPLSCILFDLAIEPLASMIRQSHLQGFSVPGADRKIITALFADDTTVFLSKNDSYHDLLSILGTWCKAARAKFNTDKTVIIPIGSLLYRTAVVTNRKLNDNQPQLPSGADAPKILSDGQYTRILGAFIGNHISPSDPWQPMLMKINKALTRWKSAHPTFHGKKLIVQMIVGGFTQYLTKVQGMPKPVEDSLVSTIRSFMWDDKQPRLSLPSLHLPIDEGGLGLLDLRARNRAIELTWVKSFLDLSPTRPLWAYVVDAMLTTPLTRTTLPKDARMNPFLQAWNVPTTSRSKLPDRIKSLFKIAKLCNVHISTVKVSKSLRRHLPIWYHVGASSALKKLNNIPSAKCLRNVHRVTTVADVIKSSLRHRKPHKFPAHSHHHSCGCVDCASDSGLGCKNPALCSSTAAKILETLHPIWQPANNPVEDGLSLKKKALREAPSTFDDTNSVVFNPSVTTRGHLVSLFRVFASPVTSLITPAHRRPTFLPRNQPISITIDSALADDHATLQLAGGFSVDHDPNSSGALLVPHTLHSKLAGPLAAILEACKSVPPDSPLHIRTSSRRLVENLTFKLQSIEDDNWTAIDSPLLFQHVVNALRARNAPTSLLLVSDEQQDPSLAAAREAARQCLRARAPSAIDLSEPLRFIRIGFLLSTITQASAYRTILSLAPPATRARSANMTLRVQLHLAELLKEMPSAPAVWKATRLPAFSRQVRTFLWKALHDIHSTGAFWSKIPDRSHFEMCPSCNVIESLEHILTECDMFPRKLLWSLARHLLSRKRVDLPPITLGSTIGCGLLSLTTKKSPRTGATRLLHIVLSETSYLLWKLCCERRISLSDDATKYPSIPEVSNRWYAAIDTRLNLDKNLAARGIKRHGLSKQLVDKTWGGLLQTNGSQPFDWISSTARVLVGRGSPGARRPRRPPDG